MLRAFAKLAQRVANRRIRIVAPDWSESGTHAQGTPGGRPNGNLNHVVGVLLKLQLRIQK